MSRRAALACAVLLTALSTGCGDHQHQSRHNAASRRGVGTPATDAQVLSLARVLESDYVHGGAHFSAFLRVDGQSVKATGRVDFRSGRGTMRVGPVDPGQGPPRQFFWTRTRVLAEAAPRSRRFEPQVPDEQGNPVHALIGFINLLSAATIDNTANISAQSPLFLGHTTIGRAPVDEYRYGGDTTLWILAGSGLLRQISTTRVPGGLTVDLLTHETVTIELPRVGHG